LGGDSRLGYKKCFGGNCKASNVSEAQHPLESQTFDIAILRDDGAPHKKILCHHKDFKFEKDPKEV
jgi:hypothetical protein